VLVLVLNGPNLNLLGTRSPQVYGEVTLRDLEDRCRVWGRKHDMTVESYQSNHEGDLVDKIQEAAGRFDAIVINPGALTHYSYSLHDAIEAVGLPTVEVHISDIANREPWRANSVIEPVCVHSIIGHGIDGYRMALEHLAAT
jgi:3-dehydroquinate dehydratase-2